MGPIPPQNIDAEMAVLGALLLGSERAIGRAWELLRPADFYHDAHQRIYDAIASLWQQGTAVDIVTLKDEMDRRGDLDAVGGLGYLMALGDFVPTTANVAYYANIVERESIARSIIAAGGELVALGYGADQGEDGALGIADLASRAESIVAAAVAGGVGRRAGQKARIVRETLGAVLDDISAREKRGGGLTGISTGFRALDRITYGLRPGEVIIIGGRPGMGKTAIFLSMLRIAAMRFGLKAAIFELEMPDMQLVRRMLSAESFVPLRHIMTGRGLAEDGSLSSDEWRRLHDASQRLWDSKLMIDDTPALTIPEIRHRCRRMKAEMGGLDVIAIDYLQIMATVGKHGGNRNSEMTEIANGIQALAREFNCPLIALSQLSRSVESRADKRPVLSDLRDSGSLEQVADIIAFMYNPAYYERKKKEGEGAAEEESRPLKDFGGGGDAEGDEEEEADDNSPDWSEPVEIRKEEVEVLIEKGRNCETGTAVLMFQGHITRFDSCAPKGMF